MPEIESCHQLSLRSWAPSDLGATLTTQASDVVHIRSFSLSIPGRPLAQRPHILGPLGLKDPKRASEPKTFLERQDPHIELLWMLRLLSTHEPAAIEVFSSQGSQKQPYCEPGSKLFISGCAYIYIHIYIYIYGTPPRPTYSVSGGKVIQNVGLWGGSMYIYIYIYIFFFLQGPC